jgi:hypothetical protein
MSTLGDLRNGVATLLAEQTDKDAYAYVPARFQPPGFIVTNGDPYVEPGETFGGNLVRLDVNYVTSASKANAVMTEDADALLEDAITALVNDDWTVETVYINVLTFGQATGYFTATITVTKTVNL